MLILTASGPSSGPITFLGALLETNAERYVIVHLANDTVIGQRDRSTSAFFAARRRNAAILNIFEPDGLDGHSGAYLSKFSQRFSDCILTFLEPSSTPTGSECDTK